MPEPSTTRRRRDALHEGSDSLAIFDLDRTLIDGSSLRAFGRAGRRAGFVRPVELLRHVPTAAAFRRRGLSDGRTARVRDVLLRQAAGLEYDALVDVVAMTAPAVIDALFVEARWLVASHLERGDFCVVLSASPQELVDVVRAELGCHRSVGTRLEVEDGRLTGRLAAPFCYGTGKLTRLEAELGVQDLADSTAYADSASDLPLLRCVGRPVAVNPDRALAAVATSSRWPVLRFGARSRGR